MMTETNSLDASAPASGGRLVSLDVLRGFDMFWILGMEELAHAIGKASDAPWAEFVALQISHVSWEGFHFLDLVFPLFLFIMGVSSVFSLEKSLVTNSRMKTFRKLLIRCLILYVLGLMYYGGLSNGIENVRWVGVLQRIAICGLAAGSAYLFLGRQARYGLFLSLLVGYWILSVFVPVPGGVAGDFSVNHNWANWIDANYLAGYKWCKTYDPEGLLGTFPAIASATLGVFAGEWLRRQDVRSDRKALLLLAAGAGFAAAGWLCNLHFPVIKEIWTSSYVLVSGGYSCMLLGTFYWLIDVCGFRRGIWPFVWIGMNPITLYLAFAFIPYGNIAKIIAGGPVSLAFGNWEHVWLSAVVVALNLLVARFLHSRKIFLRV